MAEIYFLGLRLSGGATNNDPDAALGGAISSTGVPFPGPVDGRVLSDNDNTDFLSTTMPTTTITGITILDAWGNTKGLSTLDYTQSTSLLRYGNLGASNFGDSLDISIDGTYTIYSDDAVAALVVDIVNASLPVANETDANVDIGYIHNELLDDVGLLEAQLGDVEYRCLYVVNTHGADVFNGVSLYIETQLGGGSLMDIAVGLDPAGINGTATTIGDEDTAPGGVAFSQPTSGSPLVIGNLTTGDYQAVWVRRTVTAGAPGGLENRFTLAFRAAIP